MPNAAAPDTGAPCCPHCRLPVEVQGRPVVAPPGVHAAPPPAGPAAAPDRGDGRGGGASIARQLKLRLFDIIKKRRKPPPEKAVWRDAISEAVKNYDETGGGGARIKRSHIRHVALAIWSRADRTGVVQGFAAHIFAADTDLSVRTVQVCIRRLNDLKLLSTTKQRRCTRHVLMVGDTAFCTFRDEAAKAAGTEYRDKPKTERERYNELEDVSHLIGGAEADADLVADSNGADAAETQIGVPPTGKPVLIDTDQPSDRGLETEPEQGICTPPAPIASPEARSETGDAGIGAAERGTPAIDTGIWIDRNGDETPADTGNRYEEQEPNTETPTGGTAGRPADETPPADPEPPEDRTDDMPMYPLNGRRVTGKPIRGGGFTRIGETAAGLPEPAARRAAAETGPGGKPPEEDRNRPPEPAVGADEPRKPLMEIVREHRREAAANGPRKKPGVDAYWKAVHESEARARARAGTAPESAPCRGPTPTGPRDGAAAAAEKRPETEPDRGMWAACRESHRWRWTGGGDTDRCPRCRGVAVEVHNFDHRHRIVPTYSMGGRCRLCDRTRPDPKSRCPGPKNAAVGG